MPIEFYQTTGSLNVQGFHQTFLEYGKSRF